MSLEAVFDTLAPDSIIINEIQAREKLGDLKVLAASIEAQGLHNPLQVWDNEDEHGNPRRVLLAGHRRLAAIKLLIEAGRANGLSEDVPVRLIKADTEVMARQIALVNNIEAKTLTTYEIAQECARLKDLGETQKSIAAGINRSEPWVSRKIKALGSACKELRKAWQAERLPDDTVENIAQMPEEDQAEAVEAALESREEGTKEGKGKARKEAAEKVGKPVKLGAKAMKEAIALVDCSEQELPDYVRGVFDAFRAAQGVIPVGKMGPEWKNFVKEEMKLAKARAAELEDEGDDE